MAIKVNYDVPTSELQSGDIVVRDDEAQRFVAMDPASPFSEYVTLHWSGTDAKSVSTWSTTAQLHNTWPLVIREA